MILDLDHTLGCGQVFRWFREGEWWSGVLGDREVWLRQCHGHLEIRGRVTEELVRRYLRADDDLRLIYREISADPVVADLVRRYHGLRLIRQDPWECSLSYLLATHANFPRIQRMVEAVCREFGRPLEFGRYSFPSPEEIVGRGERARHCGLGFRCDRMVEFARSVSRGELDLEALKEMDYRDCVSELKRFKGVGDKVADCVALFSLEHLNAFPVDVRIKRALGRHYGVEGPYRKVREFAQEHFGRFAGYAQEFLYMA
ncbi:MAG: DNA-3-methyladenine glycosylase family protein [Methanomassiliicoccales archaeon]